MIPAIRNAITGDVHDRADGEEDREQDQEAMVVGAGVSKCALVMLVAASTRQAAASCSRGALHRPAVSELRGPCRGVSVSGVVLLISSPRLDTASLLGWPDKERT